MSVNERLKYLRCNILNLSQREFAEQIHLQMNTISRIEHYSRNPSNRTLKDISTNFGVNLSWLTDGIEPIFVELKKIELEEIEIPTQNSLLTLQEEKVINTYRVLAQEEKNLIVALMSVFTKEKN